MTTPRLAYAWIILCVLLTVYGQLVFKWQANQASAGPVGLSRSGYIAHMLLSPWVWSGFIAAFGASVCWMLALQKLPLSKAYPFTASNFLLILVLSALFFGEHVTLAKTLGTALIMAGIVVMSFTS